MIDCLWAQAPLHLQGSTGATWVCNTEAARSVPQCRNAHFCTSRTCFSANITATSVDPRIPFSFAYWSRKAESSQVASATSAQTLHGKRLCPSPPKSAQNRQLRRESVKQCGTAALEVRKGFARQNSRVENSTTNVAGCPGCPGAPSTRP